MSTQRLRRWVDIVQMLYKCFVSARTSPGVQENYPTPYQWTRAATPGKL